MHWTGKINFTTYQLSTYIADCTTRGRILPLVASVKVYNTIVILIKLYKCRTLLILQNRQVCFCFWTKGNKWCQSVFCIHFLDLKNKQKSAKIIKAMCTTQKQAHIIFPQIKHLPSNKHPPPSKHPPLRPRPIQISTPPVSPAHHFLKW